MRLATLQILQESLKGYACAAKNGRTTEDVGVADPALPEITDGAVVAQLLERREKLAYDSTGPDTREPENLDRR